jgi:acyl-CoA reductase-like NAD-dependent aldehyde dehydrogenase
VSAPRLRVRRTPARSGAPQIPAWVAGHPVHTGGWIDRVNPARTDELVGQAARGDAALADEAIAAATRAWPSWWHDGLEQRAARLRSGWAAVQEVAEELAVLLCRELGKVLADCHGELAFSGMLLERMLADAPAVLAESETDGDAGRLLVVPEPYGVVAAITPWNAPLVLAMLKVAPALATGNAVIVKPSPVAPLAVTRMLGLLAQALPPGVLAVVPGDLEVGRALTDSPAIGKIAFTGGVRTGRRVAEAAGGNVVPLVLELGGNDAAIVLEDADLSEEAVERLVLASFLTSGQVCMAAKRVYVQRSRLDELVERYRECAARALVVGDPMAPATTVGPVATEEQVGAVAALIDDARARGGVVHDLGTVPEPEVLTGGWFVRPVLMTGVDDSARVVAEEQFGPVVPVLPFDTEDEAVARANASDLGLASSVWSTDEDRAFALARQLRAGTTFVNTHNRSGMSLRAPFGGMRRSGYGREYGLEGLREYVQPHAINLPSAFRPGASGGTAGGAYPGT